MADRARNDGLPRDGEFSHTLLETIGPITPERVRSARRRAIAHNAARIREARRQRLRDRYVATTPGKLRRAWFEVCRGDGPRDPWWDDPSSGSE
jgi:hypothetical protein